MNNMDVANIKKIVILGHSGFVGGHVWRAFERQFPGVERIGMSFPELDLTAPESVSTLAGLFDSHTAVVLCSAVKRQFGDTLDAYQKNVAMCLNVARAIELAPVARLIFFSSSAVYGEDIHNRNITETTPVCVRSYYGLAKHTGELIFERVFSRLPGAFVAVRPPLIYGPGDQGHTYGPAGFLACVLQGQVITLWGDGEELREFLFVDDVCALLGRLLKGDHRGVVNLSSGQSRTFRDVMEILRELAPGRVRVDSRPRSKDKVDNAFDGSRLQQWVGGYSFMPLEQGLRRMHEIEASAPRPQEVRS